MVSDQVGSGQVRWSKENVGGGLGFRFQGKKRPGQQKEVGSAERVWGLHFKGQPGLCCWSRAGVWSWLSGQAGVLVNEAGVLVNEAGVYLAALLLRIGFQWSE